MLSKFLDLFRSKRMDATTTETAADSPPQAPAAEPTPPTAPADRLAPWAMGPAVLGLGWSEVAPNPGSPTPMLCIRAIAPVDPTRFDRVMAIGVGGLLEKVKAAANELPAVRKVQELRRGLAAADARSRAAQGRRQAAREERAAILAALESTPESAARFPIVELDIARAEQRHMEAERDAGIITTAIPAALKEADYTLRAFARSAADVRFRELSKQFAATVRELDGTILEGLLNLWMAASSTRDAGDRIYGLTRDLLGKELPPQNLEIPQDAEHAVLAAREVQEAASIERERINNLPDTRPREEASHYFDRRTGRLIRNLADGERIPDIGLPPAESSVPQAVRCTPVVVNGCSQSE